MKLCYSVKFQDSSFDFSSKADTDKGVWRSLTKQKIAKYFKSGKYFLYFYGFEKPCSSAFFDEQTRTFYGIEVLR